MRRYWAIRRNLCEFIAETIELGPFPVDPNGSDALCLAAMRRASGSHDAIAVLEEILAARGAHLAESSDGQWGWSGMRFRAEGFATRSER